MKKTILAALVFILCGCAGANISSQMRASGEPGSSKMLRCVYLSTGDAERTNNILKRYDGWKLVYMSEYTTPNKAHSSDVMCFEKPYVK